MPASEALIAAVRRALQYADRQNLHTGGALGVTAYWVSRKTFVSETAANRALAQLRAAGEVTRERNPLFRQSWIHRLERTP